MKTTTRVLMLLMFLALSYPLNNARALVNLPEVGQAAPDFELKSNEGKSISLKTNRGKWVVLYFYPKDFTSGCTIEAKNFQRDLAAYEKANTVILGVSVDSAETHQEYCSCPAEQTSLRAVTLLEQGGYTNAKALVGGNAAWEAAGGEMVKAPPAANP